MTGPTFSRRTAILGALAALSGCSAVSALNTAAVPLPTYDLTPVPGATTGRRSRSTLVIARPEAPATLDTDRIMVRSGGVSVSYLPAARWGDDLPDLLQSLLVRSIAGTGRVGYVGRAEGGPVPDTALLVRIDAFQVDEAADGTLAARVALSLSLFADRTQRVIATRDFAGRAVPADARPGTVVRSLQSVLDGLLPDMADWAVRRM